MQEELFQKQIRLKIRPDNSYHKLLILFISYEDAIYVCYWILSTITAPHVSESCL